MNGMNVFDRGLPSPKTFHVHAWNTFPSSLACFLLGYLGEGNDVGINFDFLVTYLFTDYFAVTVKPPRSTGRLTEDRGSPCSSPGERS